MYTSWEYKELHSPEATQAVTKGEKVKQEPKLNEQHQYLITAIKVVEAIGVKCNWKEVSWFPTRGGGGGGGGGGVEGRQRKGLLTGCLFPTIHWGIPLADCAIRDPSNQEPKKGECAQGGLPWVISPHGHIGLLLI